MADWTTPRFAAARVEVVPGTAGTTLVRSPYPLADHAARVTEWLMRWADERPEQTFLAERGAEGFVRFSYREIARAVVSSAQWLLEHGAGPERPVVILSDNSVDNAILQLAAMHVGVPAVPVSPAYSLMSSDHNKLVDIVGLVTPAVIFVSDGRPFAAALGALATRGVLGDAHVVASAHPPPDGTTASMLHVHPVTADVSARHARVGADTTAKILFTSGSTGAPKGVINTHDMLTSNQEAVAQLWPFLEEKPPVLLDWLPWNHTFGANHNFNMVLRHGGTLYINDGKPVPALVERTARNLMEVSPTLYFDVPRGFDVLLPFLERDEVLRTRFFRSLDLVFYAGAALPQSLWDRMEAVSTEARGVPIPMVSAWGATETSPLVTSVHFSIPRAGVIGLPAPGCEIKLVENGGKLEMRVRGPNVTPGYFRQPELTAAAFDEEGFYRIGDAGYFEDPAHPEKGIVFDGRVTENFKLSTGTWVHVGSVRVAAIAACSPAVQDAVVTGHDQDEVGLLLFASPPGCNDLCSDGSLDDPAVRACVAAGLAAHNRVAAGSSERVARALFLTEPASIDAGEITDKGYVNQRAVLERRAELVAALYDDTDPRVIRPL